jgi:hypothetical protein
MTLQAPVNQARSKTISNLLVLPILLFLLGWFVYFAGRPELQEAIGLASYNTAVVMLIAVFVIMYGFNAVQNGWKYLKLRGNK